VKSSNNSTRSYLVNLTASILLSDKQGNVLLGRENVLVLDIISHNNISRYRRKAKSSTIITIPAAEYIMTYIVTDGTSGKGFKIVKGFMRAGTNTNKSV
jgi:hypothetical protein